MARQLEEAGFDSVWVSDHVVFPTAVRSRYPFSADGRITWPIDTPWYDAVVALGMAGAVTSRVELGVAVLILPLRHPVIFAKQAASIDRLTGGRLTLGVGAGWLAEEFELLQVPFQGRGSRLSEWIGLLRACWTGIVEPYRGNHYLVPERMLCNPTPTHPIGILVGGTSRAALKRAASEGDGWLGLQRAEDIDVAEIQTAVAAMRQAADSIGREPAPLRVVLRVVNSATAVDHVVASLSPLIHAGVTDVIVDVDWAQQDGPVQTIERLRDGLPV